MRSKDVVLIAVAAYLVLKMTGAKAAAVAPAGAAYAVPTGNQNAEMWLKAGALKVGSQLIRELSRGAASVSVPVTTGYDGFGEIGVAAPFSEDSGGYW